MGGAPTPEPLNERQDKSSSVDEELDIDKSDIKALSSETRIEILRILSKRRKIAADLAKMMDMSPSTMAEHLQKLERSGLVKRTETGHKWIYYEITRKGKNVLKPEIPVHIIITMFVGLIVVVGAMGGFFLFAGRSVESLHDASSLQEGAGEQINETSVSLGYSLRIESVSGNSVIIRNVGVSASTDEISVYVSDGLSQGNWDIEDIHHNSVAIFTLNETCKKGEEVRIISPRESVSALCE